MTAMVHLQRVLDLCDPRAAWPWACCRPDAQLERELFSSAPEVDLPIESVATAAEHIGRIRYLARVGWFDPIELDLGVPCLGYPGPSWAIVDGNHRVWAAAIRGDQFIGVDVAGQVDHAAALLGVAEDVIIDGRLRQAWDS